MRPEASLRTGTVSKNFSQSEIRTGTSGAVVTPIRPVEGFVFPDISSRSGAEKPRTNPLSTARALTQATESSTAFSKIFIDETPQDSVSSVDISTKKKKTGRRFRRALIAGAAVVTGLLAEAPAAQAEHNQSHAGAYDVDADITCEPTLLKDPIYGDRMIPANLWVHGFNTDTAGTPQRVFINGVERDPIIPDAGGSFTSQDSEGRYIDGVRYPVNSGAANDALVLMDHKAGDPIPLYVKCDKPTDLPTTTTSTIPGTTSTTFEVGTTTTIRQNSGSTSTTIPGETTDPSRGRNNTSTGKDGSLPLESTGASQIAENGPIQSALGGTGTTDASEAGISSLNPDGNNTTQLTGPSNEDLWSDTNNPPSLIDTPTNGRHSSKGPWILLFSGVGTVALSVFAKAGEIAQSRRLKKQAQAAPFGNN